MREQSATAGGSALVELVLVMPLLALLLVGGSDFARVFYTSMAVSNAARTGAQYGAASVTNSADTAGMQARAIAAAQADIGALVVGTCGTANSVCASRTCYCYPDAPTTTFAPSSVSCVTTCGAGTHLAVTVSVTATKSFTTISAYPGVPRTLSISRLVEMRAQ